MISRFHQLTSTFSKPVTYLRCLAERILLQSKTKTRERNIEILKAEIETSSQNGFRVPSIISPKQWDIILKLPSFSARSRFYHLLGSTEMKVIQKKELKEIRMRNNIERIKQLREEDALNEHLIYGVHRNSIFLKLRDTTIHRFLNQKLVRAMMFEQKLVIDCAYDSHMSQKEAASAGRQFIWSFRANRLHDASFDLHFCNLNVQDDFSGETFRSFSPRMFDKDYPMNVHRECMTEKFDKSKLVYLTPHTENVLNKFNHDDIYIIGGLVDKSSQGPLSRKRAEKLGIRMASLPLHIYLKLGVVKHLKALSIDQVLNIMLEMKKHGDWSKAFCYVPPRKLSGFVRPPKGSPHLKLGELWFEAKKTNGIN